MYGASYYSAFVMPIGLVHATAKIVRSGSTASLIHAGSTATLIQPGSTGTGRIV
jgi:hypothetical protein